MADELPPLVAELIGDASDLYSVLDDVEARLTAFARQDFTANLGLNIDRLMGSLEEAEDALDAFDRQTFNANLGLNVDEALAELAAFEHVAEASNVTVPLTLDLAPALAQLAELRGAAGLSGLGGGGAGGGGGGGGGFFSTAAGAAAGGAAAKGGLLGFGTKLLPTIPLAGFGTLGAAAGFGAESIAGLAAGLVGFAAHGIMGGLALGLTSAVTTGVGALTDNAGIGQALGDIKQYGQLQGNLNQAAAVYGKGSTEYAAAQYSYNQWASTLSPGYISAVSKASAAKTQFGVEFDKATGPAATTGANIITQAIGVGDKFLPTIGKYAAQNMDIIQKSLQPLFTWLQGPGMKAFNQIEQVFSSHLPTAMQAFDQGFELLVKTVAKFAPETGGFMKDLDKLFTRLNGPGFDKFTGEVQRAIDAFRVWEKFGKAVVTMIDELFKHDAKTGQAVIESLTKLIDKFNDWANTVAGGDKLHDYMEAHKNEVLQLVGLFGNLISIMGQVHLAAGPALMTIVGDLLKFVNLLLEIPGVGKILSYVTAFEILGRHMSILSPLLNTFNNQMKKIALDGLHLLGSAIGSLGGPFAKLGGWLQNVGVVGQSDVEKAATAMQGAADQMSAAAAQISEAFSTVGTAAAGAAGDVEVAAANMDTAMATTAGDAEVSAAKVDAALGSEGLAGDLGGAGLLAGGAGGAAAGAAEGATAGEVGAEGAAGFLVKGALGKAAIGLIAVQLYNAFGEKKLSKLIGTNLASAIGDVGTGAAIGTAILPGVGTAVGAGLGGAYAERKPIGSWLSRTFGDTATGGTTAQQLRAEGFDIPGAAKIKTSSAQSLLAKDSTLQKELAAIQVLTFNANAAKSKDGANSAEYKSALKALQTTEQKYFPTLGKDVSLKGVDTKIATMTGHIDLLKQTAQAALPYTMDLAKVKTTLATQKSQLDTLIKGGASKDAIDNVRAEVKNTESHLDNIKSVVQDGANATKQVKSDTAQLWHLMEIKNVMGQVNTNTQKLHTDLAPMTGSGITIAKLPPQAMKSSGNIKLLIS